MQSTGVKSTINSPFFYPCLFRYQQSKPIQTQNWFLSRDLAEKIKATGTTKYEYWTAFFVEYKSTNDIPSEINIANSLNVITMYSPMWQVLQPRYNFTGSDSSRLCISLNIDLDSVEDYGWKLKNCVEELPIICETFACIHGQFRCKDNSACVPMESRCDGILDCLDQSDEENCPCNCERLASNHHLSLSCSGYNQMLIQLMEASTHPRISIKPVRPRTALGKSNKYLAPA